MQGKSSMATILNEVEEILGTQGSPPRLWNLLDNRRTGRVSPSLLHQKSSRTVLITSATKFEAEYIFRGLAKNHTTPRPELGTQDYEFDYKMGPRRAKVQFIGLLDSIGTAHFQEWRKAAYFDLMVFQIRLLTQYCEHFLVESLANPTKADKNVRTG